VWSDEFSGNGLPDPRKWGYDTHRNPFGWYNGELQYYAQARAANSSVANGLLRIQALRESAASLPNHANQAFTSARLVSKGLYSFTYGFVEVRAKLPCSAGTWPAIWTLGTATDNNATPSSASAWPNPGEIDIMEQTGQAKQTVLGSLHMAQNYAGNAISAATALATACTAFHNYQLSWTASGIQIGVDDVVYNRYDKPRNATAANWPFDQPQYLLLNLAMGGTLGGAVPAAFTSDQMQVDYVRVYQ
jgi:beta-glucanase (GH16 family)